MAKRHSPPQHIARKPRTQDLIAMRHTAARTCQNPAGCARDPRPARCNALVAALYLAAGDFSALVPHAAA